MEMLIHIRWACCLEALGCIINYTNPPFMNICEYYPLNREMAVQPPKKEDSQWSRLRRRRNTASVSLVADLRKAGYKRYLLSFLQISNFFTISINPKFGEHNITWRYHNFKYGPHIRLQMWQYCLVRYFFKILSPPSSNMDHIWNFDLVRAIFLPEFWTTWVFIEIF